MRLPKILVFDSGLGGLTVYDEIVKLRPQANYVYAADDAAFPYGRLTDARVISRVRDVMDILVEAGRPDIIVIACNTASTLVLPFLREHWPDIPFIGTVPAIKPAAEQSRSQVITVLATPGTVARDYTQALIRDHAAQCHVTLVGSDRLAALAEAFMHGDPPDDEAIAAELAPCFVEHNGCRTDHIVLACTHYPLLLPQFLRLAGVRIGWSVSFIDPAPAIARQTDRVLSQRGFVHGDPAAAFDEILQPAREVFFTTSMTPGAALKSLLARYGLTGVIAGAVPFEG